MSFWDHIKPSKRAPVATKVDLSPDARTITLTWDDGKITDATAQLLRQNCPCAECVRRPVNSSTHSAQLLRQNCPCAECVEEFTGRRTLDVAKVPVDLKFIEMAEVGNYALTFTFGDAHRIGIFNWEYLRQLSEKKGA